MSAVMWHGSCSMTLMETNPWWRVDLSLIHDVWHVVVTHMAEALLRDFQIWLSTTDTEEKWNHCARYSGPPLPVSVSRVTCEVPPVRGRYLKLQTDANTRLALCEVQVFAKFTGNIALGKQAYPSQDSSLAPRAVDGSRDVLPSQGSCIKVQNSLLWMVDLTDLYNIAHVFVTKVDDSAVYGQASKLHVYVTNMTVASSSKTCATLKYLANKETTVTIICANELVVGSVMNVDMHQPQAYFQLCEVEVFGSLWSDIAYKRPVLHSNVATAASGAKAVDGILGTHPEECTKVGPTKEPWWSVNLGNIYNVTGVEITTTDDQSARLRDFIVGVTNTPPDTGNAPTDFDVCALYLGYAPSGQSVRIHCAPSAVRGQHLFVFIRGRNTTLALCEVVVFGELANMEGKEAADDFYHTHLRAMQIGATDGDDVVNVLKNAATGSAGDLCFDGNRDNVWWRGSCYHGNKSLLIQMDSPNAIESVYVTTSEYFDLCHVVISVSVSPAKKFDYDSDRTECATQKGCLAAGRTTRLLCDPPVFGQTLYIETLSDNATLSMCEIAAAKVTCEALRVDPHGKFKKLSCTTQKSSYEETCVLECNSGYEAVGDNATKCQLNGTWSSLTNCTVRLCPELEVPDHARWVLGVAPFTPESRLWYECTSGYERADGELRLWCRNDGKWEGKQPNCTAITCPPLASPNNTVVVSGDPNLNTYNSTVVYECTENHDLLSGDLSRTCQDSKTWSGMEPKCKLVSCGAAAPVINADVSIADEEYTNSITYDCKPGYKGLPGGSWTRHCQANKQWSGKVPRCEEIRCGTPPTVANTTVTTGGVRVNDTAIYSCLAGYRLRAGKLTKVCNEQEQWQNEDPDCVEVHCGPIFLIENTNISIYGGDVVGGKVIYTCTYGYQRKCGSRLSRCLISGNWSTPTLICEEVNCGMPPPLKDAVVTPTCVTRGCVADYRCYVGYEGKTQRSECTVDGKWTLVTVSCTRIRCGDVATAEGVVVAIQTGDSYEDMMTTVCHRSYHQVAGSNLRICSDGGEWSGSPLTCIKTTCVTPSRNVNGAYVSLGDLTVGSNVTYKAKDHYRHVSGHLSRTCREDQLWMGEQPVFEEITCPTITIDVNTNAKVFISDVLVGSRATYSCVTGYEIVANIAITECLPSGKWSRGPPTCTRVVCGEPPTVANARSETTGLSYLDTASYTCKTGYLREGPQHTLVCGDQRRWEGDKITCTAITCATPELPPLATYNVTALTYISQVTYSCLPGFLATSGDEVRTCEKTGNWSGTAPKCEKIECSRPPDVVNTTWYEDTKSLRVRRLIYQCLPRYRLVLGQLWKVCGLRGNWTGVDPVCEATGEKVTIFVPKDEEPKTEAERIMKNIGFKNVDKKPPNIGMGATGVIAIIVPIVIIIASDRHILKRHLKMMRRNLKEGYQRFINRTTTRVAPDAIQVD